MLEKDNEGNLLSPKLNYQVKLPDISEAELSKSMQKKSTQMLPNKFTSYNVEHARTIRIGNEMADDDSRLKTDQKSQIKEKMVI